MHGLLVLNQRDASVWNVVTSVGGLVHCLSLDGADEGHTRESGKPLKMLLSELCFLKLLRCSIKKLYNRFRS